MSWYRTYRPTHLAGLHLATVRDQVSSLFSRGRVPQVWLLTGPKGTGKTSTARIIAAMLNAAANADLVKSLFFAHQVPKQISWQDPDPQDAEQRKILQGQSYVVQEWDAASHRGIDEIRALKEQVAMPPAVGLMTVYILDEVHMLTTEAFNALLKLLEEPPEHAVFMLATTERHKVPETIVSRSTVIQFSQASETELVAAMEGILHQEKITFDAEALTQIAASANGSFRDTVKLLEQLAAGQPSLTVEMVKSIGSGLQAEVAAVINAVVARDSAQVLQQFMTWRSQQRDPDTIYREVLRWLHDQVMIEMGVMPGTAAVKSAVALFLLQELQVLPGWATTPIPLLPLEVKLLEVIQRAQAKRSAPAAPPPTPKAVPLVRRVPSTPLPEESAAAELIPEIMDTLSQVTVNQQLAESPVSPTSDVVANLDPVALGTAKTLLEQWEHFVEVVQQKNSTIAAVLRSAKPLDTEADLARVAVFYKFHYEQLKQPRFQKIFADSALPIAGGSTRLEFVLQEPSSTNPAEASLTSLAEQVLV